MWRVFQPSPLCRRSVSPTVARNHPVKPHSPTHHDMCPIRPPTRGTSRHVSGRPRHASSDRCAPATHRPVNRGKTRHTHAASGSKNHHRTPAATAGQLRKPLSSSDCDQRAAVCVSKTSAERQEYVPQLHEVDLIISSCRHPREKCRRLTSPCLM